MQVAGVTVTRAPPPELTRVLRANTQHKLNQSLLQVLNVKLWLLADMVGATR
jgi:hypothetical protein